MKYRVKIVTRDNYKTSIIFEMEANSRLEVLKYALSLQLSLDLSNVKIRLKEL